MMELHKLAAAMALSATSGVTYGFREERYHGSMEPDQNYAPSLSFSEPRKATFYSKKPLTKRQKRRLRGKAKA